MKLKLKLSKFHKSSDLKKTEVLELKLFEISWNIFFKYLNFI